MKKINPLLMFYLVLGAILTFTGAYNTVVNIQTIAGDKSFEKTAAYTMGTIAEINQGEHITVIVKYTVEGKEYSTALSHYDFTMRVGDQVKIYYNPDYPQQVISKGNTGGAILWIFNLAFLGAGTFCLYKFAHPFYAGRLIKTGQSVMAEVTSCGLTEVRANRQRMYMVECKWTDENGITHFYNSDYLMYDPQDCIIDNKVEVFVDPKNYNKYKVNL